MSRNRSDVDIVTIRASDYGRMYKDLVEKHWDELAKNKELMILDPDYERYRELEKADLMLTLGAFWEGNLIGYSANFIMPSLHYKSLKFCQNDVLFVDKRWRGRVGLKLIKLTEKWAKDFYDCDMMLWHAKEDTDLDKLMPRMGYKVQDILYSKELK